MKKIYVAHAANHPDFKELLYKPLNEISGAEFLFPHESNGEMKFSKEIIKNCDLFIADVSFQKLGTGIEIGYANAFNVPIIFIYKKGSKLSRSLNMVSDVFIEYDKISEILDELKNIINKKTMKYEVEIKSLLQTEENAQKLRDKLEEQGIKLSNKYSQLNHYFSGDGDFAKLEADLLPLFDGEKKEKLKKILEDGSGHSLRTREMNKEVFFVVKASVDDTTSENGILRMEFEEKVDASLGDLDKILEESGFDYQAKWSRNREEYNKDNFYITIDKNAGYGYVSEFEIETEDQDGLADAKQEILDFMGELGLLELSQDRLERMFKFYNENWRDYYGTENVFNVE